MKQGDMVLVADTREGAAAELRFGVVTHVPTAAQRRYCNYAACVRVSERGDTIYVVTGGRWYFAHGRHRRPKSATVGAIAPATTNGAGRVAA